MVRWMTAFLDTPAAHAGRAAAETFWATVTASRLSEPWGVAQEFRTLLPPDGDPYLAFQYVGSVTSGCHVDLHVADLEDAARRAVDLGATRLAAEDDLVVLRSPAGLPFCLARSRDDRRRPVPVARDGVASLVDQVCLDLPADDFDAELRWWAELTGWAARPGDRPEFASLRRPPEQPLRLFFQRLGPDRAEPGAHVDVACTDRAAVSAVHQRLGARMVRRTDYWDTLRDPADREYCLTDRDPRD